MTVYVDSMRAPLGRLVMCHMVADTDAELHAMASRIGVDRRHHQAAGTHQSHYDVCLAKRALAMQAGAVEINRAQLGQLLRLKRKESIMTNDQAAGSPARVRGNVAQAIEQHVGESDGITVGLPVELVHATIAALDKLDDLQALINHPELEHFLRAVHIEAVHQVERWGTAHDRAKRAADWFWLVGYLGGKALHAAIGGTPDKALHHTISTAAALYNWHSAIKGTDVRMCPGRSDLAEVVDREFPGEAPLIGGGAA